MNNKAILTNPPLVELVIGIQFNNPIINNELINKIYNSLFISDFPKIEEKQPIPSAIEEFNKPTITRILNGFHSRKLFISCDNNKLIQIQPDKILFNWRKVSNEDLYPRFNNVFQEFFTHLNKIEKLIKCKDEINQYEITYIDHFQLDLFNIVSYNLSKIFNVFTLKEELSSILIIYSIPQSLINGNLNMSFQSAIRSIDNKKIIAVESSCRGYKKEDTINEWFKNSHDILYDYFFSILTEESKKILGYKNE